MNHILYVRFYFDNDDLFEKYLYPFEKYFISSLKLQKNKNFILNLYSNKRHQDKIKSICDIDYLTYNYKDYKEFVIKNNIEIQTRHDCDDWMHENYINKIQELWKKYNDYNLLIHSQPIKLIDNLNKEVQLPEYTDNRISMHASLCLKNNKSIGIMDVKHAELYKFSNKILKINNYTKWCIHENNISILNRKQP